MVLAARPSAQNRSARHPYNFGEFRCLVERQHTRAVIALEGELDFSGALELRDTLAELLEDGHDQIVLDLALLDFIGSRGLGVIAYGWRRAEQHGTDLLVLNPGPHVAKVLGIAGLQALLGTEPVD